jgi:hypothetical protein
MLSICLAVNTTKHDRRLFHPSCFMHLPRYLLYLSTPSSGAGATHDLRAALRLLVDLSALDTLQQQRQQQQEWQQDPAQQSRSDSDSALPAAEAAQRGTAPETRPRALLAAFYDRVGARPAKGPCHVHSTALCVSSHMEQSQATTIMHKNQI